MLMVLCSYWSDVRSHVQLLLLLVPGIRLWFLIGVLVRDAMHGLTALIPSIFGDGTSY